MSALLAAASSTPGPNPTAAPPATPVSNATGSIDALSALLSGNISARTISACDEIGITIGGADREKLKKSDPKTYAKLKEHACAGMTSKFKLMTVVDEKSAVADLQSIYSIQVRLRELRKELVQNNLIDVFTIFSEFESTLRPGYSVPLPSTDIVHRHQLLDKYNVTNFENVKRANAFYMICGADYQVENLKWSGEKILESCEEALREKILESATLLPPEHHGGPVYFYLMMQLVSTTSDHAMRCIVDKLKHLKLSDFDGENVLHAVTFLRGAINLLKNNNAVPHDMRSLLFTIMRGCSTSDFVSFVVSIETMISLPGIIANPTIEFLLTTFEAKYTELLGANKWEAKSGSLSGSPSAFQTKPNPQSSDSGASSDPICFNCGTIGHKVDSCPRPRDQAQIDRFRAALQRITNRSSGGGKDNADDKGRRSRSGPGGPADPLRAPPGKDEPRTKSFPTIGERFWCGKCKVWTDHLSGDHPVLNAAQASSAPSPASASGNHAPSANASSPRDSVSALSDSPSSASGSAAALVDADGFQTVTSRSYRSALVNQSQLANMAHF